MSSMVTVDGVDYELEAEPARASLSDGPAMMWGFPVNVRRDGELVSRKTCFVGRLSVQARDPEAPDAPYDVLEPILHDLAFEKILARIEAKEFDSEILFA